MIVKNVQLINVYFIKGNTKLLMGRLAIKDRKIFFEYAAEFIKTGLELSPFKLPLKAGVIPSKDRVFGGNFGIFNDSLPDGWGKFLLDRKLMKMGFNPDSLSPLDRLCYVGSHGMGALCYEPEIAITVSNSQINLDEIAEEILQFQKNDNDTYLDNLLSLSGSSSGVRPKAMVMFDGSLWIVKFRSSYDLKDIGQIEYAYHLMAKNSKLKLPEAKLFFNKKATRYFGVKRFDRVNGDKRLHMHTISGLLHIDHRNSSLDYETIMKVTLYLTKDVQECEKQFRLATFNVLSHNRDDHAKNFSFLMDENFAWKVSPAYDLTFSSGPNGEHCSTVIGEGRQPGEKQLLKLAKIGGIKEQKARQIIDEIKTVVSNWDNFAEEAGVSNSSRNMIKTHLLQVQRNF